MEIAELSALYERFAPLLCSRARRIVGGSDADDVVQEVFMKVLATPAMPVDPSQLVAWLYTATTNQCLDRLRHHARRHDGWQAELRASLTGARGGVDELLASKDLCRKLLASVDERTQEIVVLVHLDEMTQQEAADQLGVSRKTVVKRLAQFVEHTEKAKRRWQT